MDLVTVTCLRDIDDMIRQAESIERFVDSCVHWVIVNDNNINLFKEKLTPYYKNHCLHLVHLSNSILDNINCGYRKQQMLKLYMANFLHDKYLVLDSKNFFIKNTNINEFKNQTGCGILEIVENDYLFYSTVDQYKKLIQFDKKDNTYLAIQTPFVIDPAILRSYDISDLLFKFSQIYPHMSEFFLYSLIYEKETKCNLVEDISKSMVKHYTAFEDRETIDEIIKIATNPNTKVLAFHRNYLENISNNKIKVFNNFLSSAGLKNLLKEKNV